MRKQSFLSLSVVLMLFLSACTKEDNLENYNPPTPVENNTQDPYSVSYSYWTADASLTWSDGATTEPSRESDLIASELTQEMIDAGSFVLMYAKSNLDGAVQAMPAEYSDLTSNETNSYYASYSAVSIFLSHKRSIDGTFEIPNDSNEISFRYIIVTPNTPDPNGRPVTIDDFRDKSYKEVVDLFGIPE
jgi:hypothetical protein